MRFSDRFADLLALLISSLIFTYVTSSPAASNVTPFRAIGDVAAVQTTTGNGDTRLYAQNITSGGIFQTCVLDAFTTGSIERTCNDIIVPGNEVLLGTPIAVTVIPSPPWYGFIHLFFVSPDNILSEYIYQPVPPAAWMGGQSCADCITNQGFTVVEGTQALYVLPSNTTSRELRVGFISQGAPGTITEAVYDGTGWQVAGLPN